MNTIIVGNIGLYEVCLFLTRQGKNITCHGGVCAFDLSDNEGNRYEVKTAHPTLMKLKQKSPARSWYYGSSTNRNIAKFEYTCYVCLSENSKLERIYIIPKEHDRYINGQTAYFSDSEYQKAHSNQPHRVTNKWYDQYRAF